MNLAYFGNPMRWLSRKAGITARHEAQLLAIGTLLSRQLQQGLQIRRLADAEFKIFSQWGDDGIIQWLVHTLDLECETFIEFGVEDYREANTRFLMMNNNWSGMVLDASRKNIAAIKSSEYFWKHNLIARQAFVDCENINRLLEESGLGENLGILHIDIDGNDYWIWDAIRPAAPQVVIVEYNAVLGNSRPISTPYESAFRRSKAHHSNLYFGASLPAFIHLANSKGYTFIGCNSAGNNAYFIRDDKLSSRLAPVVDSATFVDSKFRESRDAAGKLTYLHGTDRISEIKGLPVINVETGERELI